MGTFFISDLHLSRHFPKISQIFMQFLQEYSPQMRELYILGDLFDAWIGDDAPDPSYIPAIQALQAVDCPIYFLPGNRDFLVSKQFEQLTGCQILADPIKVDLYQDSYLLSHGDLFCTDDLEYQNFRQLVRNPQWQEDFLSKTIEERIAMAQQLRAISQEKSQQKSQEIMDVNPQTVDSYMQDFAVKKLIHGHTHRMFHHYLDNGSERIVLGDWSENSGNYIVLDEKQLRLETYSPSL